jgi:hypothetical protein
MPNGKPADIPCLHLDPKFRCRLFGLLERPAFCRSLKPSPDMCGNSREEALEILSCLERLTKP